MIWRIQTRMDIWSDALEAESVILRVELGQQKPDFILKEERGRTSEIAERWQGSTQK